MNTLKFLKLYAGVVLMVVGVLSNSAESTLLVYFNRAPPARSRSSTAVFQFLVERLDGSNACKRNGCSFSCELDGKVLPCRAHGILLKNLTVNQEHNLLFNVATNKGERNSSSYSWFIDTISPTATISSEQTYTNAKRITVDITFGEPCTRLGGLNCLNSSNCDVMVTGPALVQANSLKIITPGTKYSLDVILSSKIAYGRAIIGLADKICADEAGNQFVRTNSSTLIIHFDRRPVMVDFWTSVPSYELIINKVPRTVVATNKTEDLIIFLDFSIPIRNSTEQILNALHVNSGILVPFHGRRNEIRRFAFKLTNISRTAIITVELQATSILGKTDTPVSPVAPITFLYDSTKPGVTLKTGSPSVTKESDINIIVEFTKPVFGFEASMLEIVGGNLIRPVCMAILETTITHINHDSLYTNCIKFKELSRALYSLTVLAVTQTEVLVTIPAGKVTDISGNENMASNQLEVEHYPAPLIPTALSSFVSAGTIATSLVAVVVSLSSANLEAMSIIASGEAKCVASNPSMNLHGMIGHIQVFALSSWFSVNQPIQYSETTRGLRWLIPHHKLPWKNYDTSIWANIVKSNIEGRPKDVRIGANSDKGHRQQTDLISSFYIEDKLPPSNEKPRKSGWLHHQHNITMADTFYGLPLSSSEYFIYFLRGEPMSAINVIKRLENYKGWQDLQMNLFWLGVGGGSLFLVHVFMVLFLRWRTGKPPQGSLSVPRFELFLLILMLPCISQSSTFVIKGGTKGGIITGAFLLAIPSAFILSISLFLIIAIFSGSFARYQEVRQVAIEKTWYMKFWVFFTGRSTSGKWFYREGLPFSFLSRFGILFDSWKGYPMLVFVDKNDPNAIAKWTESYQTGIGRMKAVSSDDSNEEIKISMSKWVLGCARSSYIILDLLRRVGLGIISVGYPSEQSSKSLLGLIITLVQFIYLFAIKPYIRRGVQVAESVSLLCEVGVFGIFIIQNGSNSIKAKNWGFVMLVLLLFTFIAQLINQWYAMMRSLLQLSQPEKKSFRHALKFAAKGLILPFLPRKHWSSVISKTPQPKIGLLPFNPLHSGTEFARRKNKGYMDPISAMTATVVPVLSPGTPSPNVIETRDPTTSETAINVQREDKGKRLKGHKPGQKDELKMLRELAKASFSCDYKVEEASTSYALEKQPFPDEASLGNSKQRC